LLLLLLLLAVLCGHVMDIPRHLVADMCLDAAHDEECEMDDPK
jgi:hypothetical protein